MPKRFPIACLLICLLAQISVAHAEVDPSPWSGEPITIREITIQADDPFSDGFDWPGLARAVIGLTHGDVLTPDKLERSVDVLSPLAKVKTRIEGAKLTYILHPFKRVKSIGVRGNYPLFEQDVRDAMTVAPGTIFLPQAMPEQHSLVVRRYKAEGYIDPRVRIDWEQDPEDGHYHLSVVVEKGSYYALRQVRLSGNRAMDDALLISRMATWRKAVMQAGMGRFRPRKIKTDIDELVAYYRQQGFVDASATYQLKMDRKSQSVSIDVAIDEGRRYEVEFEGRQYFSDEALRKELVLFTLGNRNNIGLYRSIRNIRQRYLQAGFLNTRVRWRENSAVDTQNRRLIVIEIEEGRRHTVQSVTIQGNRHLDADTIEQQLLTRPAAGLDNGAYVTEVLQEDLAAVQALYLQNGYLRTAIEENVVIDSATRQVAVTIDIEEGVQTRVGRTSIEGNPPTAAADLHSILQLKSGAVFQSHLVRKDENKLAIGIASLGYPHVQVRGRVAMSDDQTRADIVYSVDPGPLVQVGDIFFTGNFRTRSKLMSRQAGLKPGVPFDLTKVLAAQRNLRDMNIFDSVQVRTIGLKEKAHRVPLLVEVVEKQPYFFEIGGGFETAKGLFARTKIGDRNFRGSNRRVWLGGEISGIGHRVDAGLSAPHLLGTRIRADLGLFLEREEEFNQDFGTDTYGGNLNLSRRMSRSIVAALGWRYENREQFLREQDASADVDPDPLEPRRILVTTPTLWYDSRDSLTRPRQGWYSRFTMDISNGLDNDLDDFSRYKFDLRHFYTSRSRLTLAAMARVGYLTGDGDEGRVPEDQLFFLGGTTDVRGYAENLLRFDADQDPVGGRLALSGSVEARYDLGRNIELTAFVDAGSLQLASVDAGTEDWRWSVGLGLSYITPIGPIGLFYGHKIDPRPEESRGQFHFSIGYTF